MQALAIVATIIAAIATPTVAGWFSLRSIKEKREAEVLDAKAAEVVVEAVDVYGLLQASIIREAAEKDAHARTKRQLAACRRANRAYRSKSGGA